MSLQYRALSPNRRMYGASRKNVDTVLLQLLLEGIRCVFHEPTSNVIAQLIVGTELDHARGAPAGYRLEETGNAASFKTKVANWLCMQAAII